MKKFHSNRKIHREFYIIINIKNRGIKNSCKVNVIH